MRGIAQALNPLRWYWSWRKGRIVRVRKSDLRRRRFSYTSVDPRLLDRPVPRWRWKRGGDPVDPELLREVRFGDRIWSWSKGGHPSYWRGGYALVRKGRIVATCGLTPPATPHVRKRGTRRSRFLRRIARLRGEDRA